MNFQKRFGVIPVASLITSVSQDEIAGSIQSELVSMGALKIDSIDITMAMPVVFLVLTGGTEQKILDLYAERKKIFKNEPVLLIAHPSNNSLPSSLEVLAKLQQDGINGKIIYWDEKPELQSRHELNKTLKFLHIYHNIIKTRIGLIGEPSGWLAASSPDCSVVQNVWGAAVEKIEIEELIDGIAAVNSGEGKDNLSDLVNNADAVLEPTQSELVDAVKVHSALKKIISKYDLSALTVRCFDLVTELKTTGCYALARLNDEGIIAGCEGDLVSVLGMVWLNHFTGNSVWMANPARIDESGNSIWIAHCTIPVNMVESYKLRSHFESSLGLGIQGNLSNGAVTLVRLGGKNLDKIWIANGEIIECGDDENLCRTQVHVKLHGEAKPADLLKAPLGNHLLMVKGNHAEELYEWWRMFIKN